MQEKLYKSFQEEQDGRNTIKTRGVRGKIYKRNTRKKQERSFQEEEGLKEEQEESEVVLGGRRGEGRFGLNAPLISLLRD